jgi:hypothetical protein
MCWFIIDLKTGDYGKHVEMPSPGNTLYLHNLVVSYLRCTAGNVSPSVNDHT